MSLNHGAMPQNHIEQPFSRALAILLSNNQSVCYMMEQPCIVN